MAASKFEALRLNYEKDKDILEALENAKDRTKELKRLLRLGIQVSKGTHVVIEKPPTSKHIDWRPIFKDA